MLYSSIYDGDVAEQVSLQKYTSYRIGGNAEVLYRPYSVQGLQEFVKQNSSSNLTFLGLGSNILVADRGISGAVIVAHKGLKKLLLQDKYLYCEAGVACAKIAKYAQRASLSGAEFLIGIPGTIGGAVFGNAGCFGSEVWDIVETVEFMTTTGAIIKLSPKDVVYGYRYVRWPQFGWVVGVNLKLIEKHCNNIQISDLLKRRQTTQPIGQRSCGSVFKNPVNSYAGKLIEDIGLKGKTVGDAQISTKHANFFVNLGKASGEDMYDLIHFARQQVLNHTGYYLDLEMQFLGF